jgi:hypothetical protein
MHSVLFDIIVQDLLIQRAHETGIERCKLFQKSSSGALRASDDEQTTKRTQSARARRGRGCA